MQSGIKASEELQTAFKTLLTTPSQRGIIASISSETLVPSQTIPSTSPDFETDLANVAPLVTDNAAAYIILRQQADTGSSTAAGNCVAITYVPDHAPVRQKMLFASTRLSLLRELGTEHFHTTIFATTKAELTAEGWAKHQAHEAVAAPLTEEERNLVGIREAEARESVGTGARSGGHLSNKHTMAIDEEAAEALRGLKTGRVGLVQLQIDVTTERIILASQSPAPLAPSLLSTTISPTSPRHSFYAYAPSTPSTTSSTPTIIFISSCPPGTKIKERMLHASARISVIKGTATDAGLEIAARMEVSSPSEIEEADVVREVEGASGVKEEGGKTPVVKSGGQEGFSRPKRPGRR